MKNLYIKLMLILFICSGFVNNVLAQAPEGIIYQAEARDDKGKIIANSSLDVKITIHEDDAEGDIVWEGLHEVTTNEYGMFVLVIGEGVPQTSDLFKDIKWAEHRHFLNVGVKKPNKTVYVDMGTTQLLSVPYALHAKTAGTVLANQDISGIATNEATIATHMTDDTDTDPTNEIELPAGGTAGQVLTTDGAGNYSWTTIEGGGTTSYKLGDFAHGGIVFLVSGEHGFVCDINDLGFAMWAGAMYLCENLVVIRGTTTYDDWFLPSKDVLNMMYLNKEAINATANAIVGGTDFFTGEPFPAYWSSTEESTLSYSAWIQYFTDGSQVIEEKLGIRYRVRAVRAF